MSSSEPPASRRWLVLVICAASAGSMVLDLTKSNLALPSIEHALQPGPVGLQLIVAGYILSFALTVVPAGWLGDRGLRRRVLIFALGLYLLSSAASALAPGVELLVVARVVQGIAAGLVIPPSAWAPRSSSSSARSGPGPSASTAPR